MVLSLTKNLSTARLYCKFVHSATPTIYRNILLKLAHASHVLIVEWEIGILV